ncbi:hypothetical protein [Stutzerimonas nosocomialis]|uniref:hypothetical protein n=1 Tax=Stutzerimonas nosocomialis TaxID=1056496 RepID=UPI0015755291|nr:hypothetical protein [Stutzerimonas nosocomialis]
MIDKDDPLVEEGQTPTDYDEYGEGPNVENAPENIDEAGREQMERQKNIDESPLG